MKPPIKNCVWAKYPYGDVSQWFGENKKLYSKLDLDGHNGIDIVRPHGEHMYAVEDGIIVDVKDTPDGYGKHFRLFNKLMNREWSYGHCSYIGVKVGQTVRAGQFVATMGNTGFVVSGNTPFWGQNPYAGTHLHLGLRRIKPDSKGWSYPESDIKIKTQNYDNGFKGSVDFLKYFVDLDSASYKVGLVAQKKDDKVVWQLSQLLKILGM